MTEYLVDGLISVNPKLTEIGKVVISILESGRAAEIIVQPYSEKATEKRRSNAQNKLYFLLYQRIAKTLFGGDEKHARRECKLLIGCRILRRDNQEFSSTYDSVIRVLSYDLKLKAMDLISVSSIMGVKQGTEYIKKIIEKYSESGCYFADLEGIDGYLQYPEAQK